MNKKDTLRIIKKVIVSESKLKHFEKEGTFNGYTKSKYFKREIKKIDNINYKNPPLKYRKYIKKQKRAKEYIEVKNKEDILQGYVFENESYFFALSYGRGKFKNLESLVYTYGFKDEYFVSMNNLVTSNVKKGFVEVLMDIEKVFSNCMDINTKYSLGSGFPFLTCQYQLNNKNKTYKLFLYLSDIHLSNPNLSKYCNVLGI